MLEESRKGRGESNASESGGNARRDGSGRGEQVKYDAFGARIVNHDAAKNDTVVRHHFGGASRIHLQQDRRSALTSILYQGSDSTAPQSDRNSEHSR